MTGVLAVDPPGCGCTECLTGVYVPLDQATPGQVAAAARGVLGNNTGFDCLTDEYLAQVLAVPRTRDGAPLPDFRLRCPFCGGGVGVGYLSENLTESIMCGTCGAAWTTDGDLFAASERPQ